MEKAAESVQIEEKTPKTGRSQSEKIGRLKYILEKIGHFRKRATWHNGTD